MNIYFYKNRHHTSNIAAFVRSVAIILALIFTATALSLILCTTVAATKATLSTSAKAAILIEASTGKSIYEHNADMRLPMASTTKIMTALIAIESCKMDEIVTVASGAVGIEGSSVYLQAGENLSMEDLVYALMLESANDAAAAIAIEVAGSIEVFADLMNERAAQFGLKNTHFTNPHGLDNENHYTTARDLALLTAYAMQNEEFAKIVSTYKHTIPLPGKSGVRLLLNHNRLLRTSNEIIGVKTGFTKKSGRCLVTAARRDGVTVIAVTLSDPNDWRDHIAMLTCGLDSYECRKLADVGELSFVAPVVGGDHGFVVIENDEPVTICMPIDDPRPRRVVYMNRFYYAPISAGDVLGIVEFYDGDDLILEVPLIAKTGVGTGKQKNWFERFISSIFGGDVK